MKLCLSVSNHIPSPHPPPLLLPGKRLCLHVRMVRPAASNRQLLLEKRCLYLPSWHGLCGLPPGGRGVHVLQGRILLNGRFWKLGRWGSSRTVLGSVVELLAMCRATLRAYF